MWYFYILLSLCVLRSRSDGPKCTEPLLLVPWGFRPSNLQIQHLRLLIFLSGTLSLSDSLPLPPILLFHLEFSRFYFHFSLFISPNYLVSALNFIVSFFFTILRLTASVSVSLNPSPFNFSVSGEFCWFFGQNHLLFSRFCDFESCRFGLNKP